MNFLEVENLHVHYGRVHAVQGVSFSVKSGEIVSLIGSNGAGKSSILRALSGLTPSTGQILFEGQSWAALPVHRRVHQGLTQSPEGRGVFPQMSVEENLLIGAHSLRKASETQAGLDQAYELFPRLKERRKQISGTLSGGEQQMLSVARALMTNPRLLFLDEPSLGLAPLIVQQIFSIIQKVNSRGVSVLLVEQNASMALRISHRAYVLESGKICLEGSGRDLLTNDLVRQAYLGIRSA